MTFQIRHDGKTYTVHTEVGGNELTRVEFDEDPSQQPVGDSLECSDEVVHG